MPTLSGDPSKPKITALGFCGADDSVNPRLLALIGRKYPLAEFGILFRPDKEGLPRYATKDWVERLSRILKNDAENGSVRLAAHLCGSHVNDVLSSATNPATAASVDGFLVQLAEWGFARVQVNATAVNGVFTEKLGDPSTVKSLLRTVNAHLRLEFIVQKNEETRLLWDALIEINNLPGNIVFLHDESKGTGKETTGGWPKESQFVASPRKVIGYAGGIKPQNFRSTLLDASEACLSSGGLEFWIDMESGVRTMRLKSEKDGHETKQDVFDLAKCYECIDVACELGFMEHPSELR